MKFEQKIEKIIKKLITDSKKKKFEVSTLQTEKSDNKNRTIIVKSEMSPSEFT